MSIALNVYKKHGKYHLEIPASQDVKEFLVDRRIIKQYGKVFNFPMTFNDAELVIKGKKVKLKHKKGKKVIGITGNTINYPENIIFLISLDKNASISANKETRDITVLLPKKKKVAAVILGDYTYPVPVYRTIKVVDLSSGIDGWKIPQKIESFSIIDGYRFTLEIDPTRKGLEISMYPRSLEFNEKVKTALEKFLENNGMYLTKDNLGNVFIVFPEENVEFVAKTANLNILELLAKFGIALFPKKE